MCHPKTELWYVLISAGNLNQVGIDNVSTSDDEEAPKMQQVPPRMSRPQNFENSHGFMNNKDSKRGTTYAFWLIRPL